MDDLSRVAVPELVLGVHPLGCGRVVWAEAIVLDGIRLPGHVSEFDRVDCRMKVVMVEYWCGLIVRD